MVKDDVLIAKFMSDGKLYPYPDKRMYLGEFGYNLDGLGWWNQNHLKFSSSWDWLMLAWDKISNLIDSDTIEIDFNSSAFLLFIKSGIIDVNIIEAHTNIVKFIIWYNLNQQTV